MKSLIPNKKILSLDIGTYKIKFVLGKLTNKKVVVEDYFSILTPKDTVKDGAIIDSDLLQDIIDEELNKRNIRTKNVYVTINSSKIINREIVIPKVEHEEIKSIIEFQIEDYIPVEKNNYITQFNVIEEFYEEDAEKLKLLIVAIPKNLVNDYYNLIINLKLNPIVLDYQSNSIAKLINYNVILNDNYPIEDLTFASVDIGYDSTKVSIIKNGNILVSRIIDIGGDYIDKSILNMGYNIEDLEGLKENIVEIDNSYNEESEFNMVNDVIRNSIQLLIEKIEIIFRYYTTRKTNNKINIILLTGGLSDMDGLDNLFSNSLNIPSVGVKRLNYVDCDGNYSDYANAIGSIIRTQEV